MKTMGLDPSKEELQDIIDNADKNGNRKLDFDEFASFMVKKVRAKPTKKVCLANHGRF